MGTSRKNTKYSPLLILPGHRRRHAVGRDVCEPVRRARTRFENRIRLLPLHVIAIRRFIRVCGQRNLQGIALSEAGLAVSDQTLDLQIAAGWYFHRRVGAAPR